MNHRSAAFLAGPVRCGGFALALLSFVAAAQDAAPEPQSAPAPVAEAAPETAPEVTAVPVSNPAPEPAAIPAAVPVPAPPKPIKIATPARPPVVAKIEAVQLPAWIERNGVRAGVKPGWAVYPGDVLITGEFGHLELRLADDARLTLGTATEAAMAPMPETALQGPPASGFVNVRKGAFRYAAPAAPSAGRSPFPMRLGRALDFTPVAGQVWGKSTGNEDVLMLIQGALDVGGVEPVRMDEPESMLVVPRGLPQQPVAPLPRERLAVWQADTEFDPERPVLRPDGQWSVSLYAEAAQSSALVAAACRLQSEGYPTEVASADFRGKPSKRVMVRRFVSREDAERFARQTQSFGAPGAWVVVSNN